ncbi:MAG: DUF6261 family protein, partial [Bacteroidales bacterium]|nr:DUF6261 family protein [Bacteroidales bacterium]
MAEQDRIRDRIYRGFADSVKGTPHHFAPNHRQAAQLMDDIFHALGQHHPKTLGGETAAINDLVCKLERSAPVQAVALLGMSAWRDKL